MEQASALRKRGFVRMRFCSLRLFVPNKAAGLRIFRTEGACSLRNGLPWRSRRLEQAPALRKRVFFRKRFFPLRLFVIGQEVLLEVFVRLGLAPALRKRGFVRMRFCSLRLFVAEQEVLLEVFVRLEQAPSATGCLGRGSGWSKPQPYGRGTSCAID